jgi:uncharacterized protein
MTATCRRFRRLFLYALGMYLVMFLGVTICQRRLIYLPPQSTSEQVEMSAREAGLERWRDPSGTAIGLKRLFSDQPAAGQVMIVYGNGSSATGCAHYADEIQSIAALDVFILEYPGYADRPGSPTEINLYRAADEALQLLTSKQPIYLFGESLGSGVASYLAGKHPEKIAGIILLSPYDRLVNVAHYRMPFLPTQLLLIDRFPSADYLSSFHGPVGIAVDGRDRVVPEKFGLQLYNGYAGPKRLWEFPRGAHISIMEPPEKFWREVLDFFQTNRSANPSQGEDVDL